MSCVFVLAMLMVVVSADELVMQLSGELRMYPESMVQARILRGVISPTPRVNSKGMRYWVQIARDNVENGMYDKYVCMKQFVTSQKISEWRVNKTLLSQHWVEMVSYFRNNHVQVLNIMKSIELQETNAVTERAFSFMNNLWTIDKTQLGVETLKAMLITKVDYEEIFFQMLLTKKDLLKKIHSEKYSNSASS